MPWGRKWRGNWNWKRGGGGGSKKAKSSKKSKSYSYSQPQRSSYGLEDRRTSMLESIGLLSQSQSFATQTFNAAVPTIDVDDEEENWEDDSFFSQLVDVQFGSLRAQVVGIQYYRGTVSDNEMVSLVREPHNAYDRNAIKVLNVIGEQVGHIKREFAAAFAPVMDANIARLEGIIPSGAGNKYAIPIDLSLWGELQNKEKVEQILRRYSIIMRPPPPPVRQTSAAAGSMSQLHAGRVTELQGNIESELDKMFDRLEEGDKCTEREAANAICTKMYPHQKQALNWMIIQESGTKLPPFWEKLPNGQYSNISANMVTNHRPQCLTGGILADDMGLGKTLEVIALIVTNFVDGQPLAFPVSGQVRSSKYEREMNIARRRAAVKEEKIAEESEGEEVRHRTKTAKVDLRKQIHGTKSPSDTSAAGSSKPSMNIRTNNSSELPKLPSLDDAATAFDGSNSDLPDIKRNKPRTPVKTTKASASPAAAGAAASCVTNTHLPSVITLPEAPLSQVYQLPTTNVAQAEPTKTTEASQPQASCSAASSVISASAPLIQPAPVPVMYMLTTNAQGQQILVQVPQTSLVSTTVYPTANVNIEKTQFVGQNKVESNNLTASSGLSTPISANNNNQSVNVQTQAEKASFQGQSKTDQTQDSCTETVAISTVSSVLSTPLSSKTDNQIVNAQTQEAKKTCQSLSKDPQTPQQPSNNIQTPQASSGRSKRNSKKPKRFRDEDEDEEEKLPEKRARAQSAPDGMGAACETPTIGRGRGRGRGGRGRGNRGKSRTVPEPMTLGKSADDIEVPRVGRPQRRRTSIVVEDVALSDDSSEQECVELDSDDPEYKPDDSKYKPSISSQMSRRSSCGSGSGSLSPLPDFSHMLRPSSLSEKESDTTADGECCPSTSTDEVLVSCVQSVSISPRASSSDVPVASCSSLCSTITTPSTSKDDSVAKPPASPSGNASAHASSSGDFNPSDTWPSRIYFPKLHAPDEIVNLQTSRLPKPILSKLDWELRSYYKEDPEEFVKRWKDQIRQVMKAERVELKKIVTGKMDINSDEEDDLPDLAIIDKPENREKKVKPISHLDKAFDLPSQTENYDLMTGRHKKPDGRTTLIVCPVSVMSNWLNQFEEHVHENVHLEIYHFYGPNRVRNSAFLAKQDIVLTSFSTVTSEYTKAGTSGVLMKVDWLRVILDEAHHIRNPTTKLNEAINELKAKRKWVLTGTPIQNKLKDLWSLVSWLDIHPFKERSWWKRMVETPIDNGDKAGLKRVQGLLRNIAMRRMKNTITADGRPLVTLPNKSILVETLTLSRDERKMYDTMASDGRIIVSRIWRAGKLLERYGEVLSIILRLRQLCCHPGLLNAAARAAAEALGAMAAMPEDTAEANPQQEATKKELVDKLLSILEAGSVEECSICMDDWDNPVITSCAHVYCGRCIKTVIDNAKSSGQPAKCPLCRGDIDASSLVDLPKEQPVQEQLEVIDNWISSTKVDALLKALKHLRQQDPSVKSIVVSQFTSFLNIIEVPLKQLGFNFVRLDGSMSTKQRALAIDMFQETAPDSPTIFLLSLKAGGEGLNLTAASRVFLMDLAWNPATEDQCFDRCHRLGQTREVIITKYVIENSIEGRMMELQDKKRKLMTGAFAMKQNAEQRRNERIANIRHLFGF